MLIKSDYPKVFYSDNAVFSDISIEMLSYGVDTTAFTFVASQDKFYFGRVKPFNAFYIEMGTANVNTSVMTVKYFDQTAAAFAAVTGLVDETKGLTRSGFVQWAPMSDTSSTSWALTTINSVSLYWVEVTFSANLSASTLQGWNIVYSDDTDLKRIYDGVSNYFRSGTSSGILYHEQARKEIVNQLRRDGYWKVKQGSVGGDSLPAQHDEWDFHNIEEVNLWSTYLALSYLFDNLSTASDDNFARLAEKYYGKSQEQKQVYYLSIDKDNDGILDANEKLGTEGGITGTVIRR